MSGEGSPDVWSGMAGSGSVAGGTSGNTARHTGVALLPLLSGKSGRSAALTPEVAELTRGGAAAEELSTDLIQLSRRQAVAPFLSGCVLITLIM